MLYKVLNLFLAALIVGCSSKIETNVFPSGCEIHGNNKALFSLFEYGSELFKLKVEEVEDENSWRKERDRLNPGEYIVYEEIKFSDGIIWSGAYWTKGFGDSSAPDNKLLEGIFFTDAKTGKADRIVKGSFEKLIHHNEAIFSAYNSQEIPHMSITSVVIIKYIVSDSRLWESEWRLIQEDEYLNMRFGDISLLNDEVIVSGNSAYFGDGVAKIVNGGYLECA